MRRFFLFITVWCVLLQTLFAESKQAGTEPGTVRIGIEGLYKNGLWTPLRFSELPAVPVAVTCSDSDGVPATYRFPNGSKEFYIKLGRANEPLTVQFGDSPPQRFAVPPPVNHERPIFLIIGNEDIGLQGAVAELALKEDRRPVLVKVKSFNDLPGQWFGYEAVDTVFLTTTEPEQFNGLTANSPQIQALDQWVKLGGRLVFCAGRDAEPLVRDETSPLSPFLPEKYSAMTELRDGKVLESFIGSKRKIFMNGTEEAPFLKMPRLTEPEGIVFAKELDLPLILRRAHGFGILVYFGGDLSGRPLAVWQDRVQFVKRILQWDTERKTGSAKSELLIQLGYNDITGQVRSALDRFDGVWIVPFSVILGILAAYWLFIGPVDWLLVKKILHKPQWTWFTFPLWIVLFCVLAWDLAALGRPNRVMLNELQLVDYDTVSDSVRTSIWANLYSPDDARYSLEIGNSHNVKRDKNDWCLQSVFSWNGLPGSGLGGMAPETVSPTVWQSGIVQEWEMESARTALHSPLLKEAPVAVRSTKSFFGQTWSFDGQESTSFGFAGDISDEEGIPIGTLRLSDTMPVLENVFLVYGRWVLELGTVPPGQEIKVGKMTKRRELRELLLSRNTLENDTLRRMSSYNSQSTDLEYIVPVLSLHSALGGVETVGLHNTFMRSLDLSSVLTADRAIVLATIKGNENVPPGILVRGNFIWRNTESIPPQIPPYGGNRIQFFRQSLPIKLTALSPRLGIEKVELKKDKRIEEKDKTISGQDEYKPGK